MVVTSVLTLLLLSPVIIPIPADAVENRGQRDSQLSKTHHSSSWIRGVATDAKQLPGHRRIKLFEHSP